MGKKAQTLRETLIAMIKNSPDELVPEVIDCGDYTNIRPRRVEKKFTKAELITLIDKAYKVL